MNKKGQITIGSLIYILIGVIVGIVLLQASADQAAVTSLTKVYNSSGADGSFTAPAVGVTSDLTGQSLLSTPTVVNKTGGTLAAGNYTIAEGVSATTGVKTIRYTSSATSEYAGLPINISYTYGVAGYADDAGARAVIPMIIIFFALAIAVITLTPVLKESVLNMVGK